MVKMMAIKRNDAIYIASTIWYSTSLPYDDLRIKNNYPIAIINNKNGNIVIMVYGKARESQIIIAHSKTLLKNKIINRKYLKDTYYPQIMKIMENESNFVTPYFDIIIVVNNKIFVISSDGVVYEKEEYTNDDDLLLTYKQHKKEFKDFELKLVDVIKQWNIVNETLEKTYVITTNTNSYNLKFNER